MLQFTQKLLPALPSKSKGHTMTATFTIENATDELLKAFKSMAKATNARFKLTKKHKSSSIPALDKAIKEYESGDTILYKDINEYKAKIDE